MRQTVANWFARFALLSLALAIAALVGSFIQGYGKPYDPCSPCEPTVLSDVFMYALFGALPLGLAAFLIAPSSSSASTDPT